ATPGPWTVDEGVALADPLLEGEGGWYRQIEGWTNTGWEGLCLRPEDAAFIAHAREDIPALVAEVERLQAELERMRPVVEAARMVLDDLLSDATYGLNHRTEGALMRALASLDA